MDKLYARNLVKAYKEKPVVRDVSFEVSSGQVVGLLGPNGAGKTTSFYMMVGLVPPTSGSVFLNDVDITTWPMHKRARNGIAYLPQEASIFRKMSVEDNIYSVLELLAMDEEERDIKVKSILQEFNIEHITKQKGYTLSGGERRRVEVARALALSPKFILLDEPFAGIDPLAVGDIQKIIQTLKRRGLGVLITDHNVRETLAICDTGYLLSEGKIFESGTPEHIANSPIAKEKYLGENFHF